MKKRPGPGPGLGLEEGLDWTLGRLEGKGARCSGVTAQAEGSCGGNRVNVQPKEDYRKPRQ